MKKSFLSVIVILAILLSMTMLSSCSGNTNNDSTTTATGIDALIKEGVLFGELDHDVKLDSTVTYNLTGTFIVGEGATFTIPAGTTIKASEGFGSYIIVLQGGKIYVNGTADKPVIMTSDDGNTDKASGYWGGLIINGKAKISGASDVTAPTYACEMNSKYMYGGNDDTDNSGSITYLEILYGGARSSADIEHNGLTLDAVGSGTTIHDVYILENADDGVECFGGCVDLKNILVVNQDDDCFDNTQGYHGTWTNMYGIWEKGYTSTESDPRGVESDGNMDGKTPTDINQTNFTIKNMTIDLQLSYDTTSQATYMQDVVKIRRGATVNITNALVKGCGAAQDLIDMNDSKGAGLTTSSISLTNALDSVPFGVSVRPGKDAEGNTLTYPNVKIESSNTGCDASIFSWTGYKNFK